MFVGGGHAVQITRAVSLSGVLVRVRLFAALRERAGESELALELPDGARVADALEQVATLTRDMPVVVAVNREYATADVRLEAGDELALIPPVSGGATHVRLTTEPLSLDRLLAHVRDPAAGAVVTFQGVTRDVPALEYEAYAEMAERELAAIVERAIDRHGLCAAAAEHRVGTVPRSEASVVIAASAPHRAEAFAGVREIIDELKARAPIWKREEGEWVRGAIPQ
jgi:molybdopterin synthase catalytic subunit